MGCGKSSSKVLKLSNPIILKPAHPEEAKDMGNSWNMGHEETNKHNQLQDWNFDEEEQSNNSEFLNIIDHNVIEENKKTIEKTIQKNEQDMHLQRRKTENIVNKIAKNNPENLGNATKEIISRIHERKITKHQQLEMISPVKSNGNQLKMVLGGIQHPTHL